MPICADTWYCQALMEFAGAVEHYGMAACFVGVFALGFWTRGKLDQ